MQMIAERQCNLRCDIIYVEAYTHKLVYNFGISDLETSETVNYKKIKYDKFVFFFFFNELIYLR